MTPSPYAQLRIRFPPPGFFLVDARLVLLLDGHFVFAGSFKQGVDLVLPVTSGHHVLSTRIELDPLTRSRDYPIVVGPEGLAVGLEYSRFWGNFCKALNSG